MNSLDEFQFSLISEVFIICGGERVEKICVVWLKISVKSGNKSSLELNWMAKTTKKTALLLQYRSKSSQSQWGYEQSPRSMAIMQVKLHIKWLSSTNNKNEKKNDANCISYAVKSVKKVENLCSNAIIRLICIAI